MTYSRIPLAMFTAAALAFGGVLASPVTAPTAQAQEDASFSDQQIRSFAEAAVKLGEIRAEYRAQMGDAQSDEQRAQLQQQTNQRMAQAVEETQGISVQEYNTIATASQNDEELASKIEQYVQEEAAE